MNQQPDTLFRKKLTAHQTKVPSQAWERIELTLNKKNRRAIWWTAAAATFLVFTVVLILLPDKNSEPGSERSSLTENKAVTRSQEDTESEIRQPVPEQKIAINKEQTTHTAPAINEKKIETSGIMSEHKKAAPLRSTPAEIIVTKKDSTLVDPTSILRELSVEETGNEHIKLVFEATDVNKKYLVQPAVTEATSSEKKASTFKKILLKAQELKTNQDPLGELREVKNEILALEFKSKKNRH